MINKKIFFDKRKDYEYLVNQNLKNAQNFEGWLLDYCPSVNLNLKFENTINTNNSVSFWNKDYTNIQCDENLYTVLLKRKSTPIEQLTNTWQEKEIMFLLNKAICDGLRKKKYLGESIPLRNYPSGGAQYPIKMYLISNFNSDFFKKNRAYSIHPDLGYIKEIKNISKYKFEDIFAITHFNKYLYAETTKLSFAIVMSMNLKQSFQKYKFYSRDLALIECGHIAQNLQLVSASIGKRSLPNGGILSDITKDFLNLKYSKDDIVVYGVAF